jgi:hypothetical protein
MRLLLISAFIGLFVVAFAQEDTAPLPVRDMDEIREALSEISNDIHEAYMLLLLEDPDAEGEIEIAFNITPAGAVVDIEVTGPEDLEPVVLVIEEALLTLSFDASEAQQENLPVSAPLVLSPPVEEE